MLRIIKDFINKTFGFKDKKKEKKKLKKINEKAFRDIGSGFVTV